MVAGGIAFLAASLPSIRSILRTLGARRLRARLIWLERLTIGFLIGYATFGTVHVNTVTTKADLFVAIMLLAGGCFVLTVSRLSDLTMNDIVRIAALERDVIIDPMTGAYSRRYLESRLDEEVDSAQRSDSPLSALMIDIDHFKHVNDSFGHATGDEVIRHVGSLIISQITFTDVVVRYGGEEFLVLSPNAGLEEAAKLGQRILDQVRAYQITVSNGLKISVSASIGLADRATAETPSAFLRRSDQALYEAKRSGRDRMCIASTPFEMAIG